MILCDTAPLFCLVDKSQPLHSAVKNFIKTNPSQLITTWSCFTEAMYLSLQRGGWRMQYQISQLLIQKLLVLPKIMGLKPRPFRATLINKRRACLFL